MTSTSICVRKYKILKKITYLLTSTYEVTKVTELKMMCRKQEILNKKLNLAKYLAFYAKTQAIATQMISHFAIVLLTELYMCRDVR